MDTTNEEHQPRIYTIRRSQHVGYGFVLGSEQPCVVKLVEPHGPSFGRLQPYDVILAINGIDVEHLPKEKIIKMVQLSDHEIDITVRRATYEEEIRATNHVNPNFYMFNKSLSNNQLQQNYSDSLNSNHQIRYNQTSNQHLQDNSPAQLNRLVTSIAQQQQQVPAKYQPINIGTQNKISLNQPLNYLTLQYDKSRKVLQQQKTNEQPMEGKGDSDNNKLITSKSTNHQFLNGSSTLGRNTHGKVGRHSPLPQRCKSSIDDSHIGRSGKKSSVNYKDEPMLKRSNTMRPIRPPAKVMEIFEVVIKIFFEDGQTKMLPYNQETTVGDVLETLKARLGSNSDQIKSYFGLAVTVNTDDQSDSPGQLASKKPFHVLDEDHPIMGIRKLPYAPKLRLLYRMIYPPSDIAELYTRNKVAFDYLYKQSCNDLRLERFSPALDADSALKLSALFIVEYVYSNYPKAHSNSKDAKFYMKLVKKDPGLKYFLPRSMTKATEDKKGKQIVGQYRRLKAKVSEQLKKNFEEIDFEPPKAKSTTNINKYTRTSFHELALPELLCSLGDYVKILFLNHLKEMPCYLSAEREKAAVLTSVSPVDRNSVGDCSSSMESVPRTSDSSPLIRQSRGHHQTNGHAIQANGYMDSSSNSNMVSRLAHMNSMRSLSSLQVSTNGTSGGGSGGSLLVASNGAHHDQTDMAQTPSIESISSITFNMHSTPSPQQVSSYMLAQSEPRHYVAEPANNKMQAKQQSICDEPSPMPRQAVSLPRAYHLDRLNSMVAAASRHPSLTSSDSPTNSFAPVDELIKRAILPLPPPPPPAPMMMVQSPAAMLPMRSGRELKLKQCAHLTPILTDKELEGLRVQPPPPRSSAK